VVSFAEAIKPTSSTIEDEISVVSSKLSMFGFQKTGFLLVLNDQRYQKDHD
jgi:hypothetical protein